QDLFAGGRHFVVAARRTFVFLRHLVILPTRLDEAFVLEPRERGIHGAAREAGRGDHVEPMPRAGGERLQHGDEGGTERKSGHMWILSYVALLTPAGRGWLTLRRGAWCWVPCGECCAGCRVRGAVQGVGCGVLCRVSGAGC